MSICDPILFIILSIPVPVSFLLLSLFPCIFLFMYIFGEKGHFHVFVRFLFFDLFSFSFSPCDTTYFSNDFFVTHIR